jgi:hypothetical protein
MKFTLILLSVLSAVSVSYAGGLPGSDNLSALVPGAGVYSRSMVTDVEDGNNSALCDRDVRVDVSVNAAAKNLTYDITSVQADETLTKKSQTIKVGRDSFSVYDTINGITVNSVNAVKGTSIETLERQDVEWLGVQGEWKVSQSLVSFTNGKVKIGYCTYRRVN